MEAVCKFQELNEILQSRTVFNNAKIDAYQRIADTFYSKWIDFSGREGVTNYIHSFGAGHVAYFLRKYRSLYKYSQQGWGHHNKRMNGIYHRHTQKGGKGAKEEMKGHIAPLFSHKTRCWMWKTKKGEAFFEAQDQKRSSASATSSSSS